MPTFALRLTWGGNTYDVANVDARWTETVPGFGEAAIAPRSVTVEAALPAEFGDVALTVPAGDAYAHLTVDGVALIAGPAILDWEPVDGERIASTITLRETSDDERGTWPPGSDAPTQVRLEGDFLYHFETWNVQQSGAGATPPFILEMWNGPKKGLYADDVDDYSFSVDVFRRDDPRFQDIPEPTQGQAMPWVFGAPGDADTPGSPAWYVDETGTDKLVIASGRVDAATVTIFGPSDTDPDVLSSVAGITVSHGPILAGGTYAYVLVSEVIAGASTVQGDPSRRYYAAWTGGAARSGLAGDVLCEIITGTSFLVDIAAWQNVRALLNRYVLAGYLDARTKTLDLIRNVFLPILPLSIVNTSRGLAPIVDPWLDDLPAGAGVPVIGGNGVALAGRITYRNATGPDALVLGYALDASTERTTRSTTIGVSSSVYASTGTVARPTEEDTTEVIYDPGTAGLVAGDRFRRSRIGPPALRYEVSDLSRFGPAGSTPLRAGTIVSITEARLSLTSAFGYVESVEIGPDAESVVIVLRHDRVRGDL